MFLVGHRCSVPGAFIGRAQKANAAISSNQQEIFERMLFFLPAVVEPLFVRVQRSVDGPFGPIMKKRVGRHQEQADRQQRRSALCGLAGSPASLRRG